MVSDYIKNIGLNVALERPTKQSSTYDRFISSKAVDGSSSTVNTSCTRTNMAIDNWWQVELDAVYEIQEVVITNIYDTCKFQTR